MKAKLFRIAATVLALTLAVSMTACGGTKKTAKKTSSKESASSKQVESVEEIPSKEESSSEESSSEESSAQQPSSQAPAASSQTPSQPAQQQPTQQQPTKPAPPASSAMPKPFDHDAYVKQIFNETNAYRAACGVAPLVWDPIANKMAEYRASELEQNFSHTRPDGRICYTIVNDFPQYHDKYRPYPYNGSMLAAPSFIINGENIIYCSASRSAVELWKNSPDHAENMRRPEFSHIGIGSYYYNGTVYSVQIFFTEFSS